MERFKKKNRIGAPRRDAEIVALKVWASQPAVTASVSFLGASRQRHMQSASLVWNLPGVCSFRGSANFNKYLSQGWLFRVAGPI